MKEETSLILSTSNDERSAYLSILKDVTNELYRKAKKGRFHDVKKDELRLKYWKGVIYSINNMNQVLKDYQLDKLEKDIEELKKGMVIEVPSKEEKEEPSDNLKKLEELDSQIEKLKE